MRGSPSTILRTAFWVLIVAAGVGYLDQRQGKARQVDRGH